MSSIDPRSISQLLESLPGANALVNLGFQVLGFNHQFQNFITKDHLDSILRSPDVRVFVSKGKEKRLEIRLPQTGATTPIVVRLLLLTEKRDESALFLMEVETEQSRIAAFKQLNHSDHDDNLRSVRDLSTAMLARIERCRRGLHQITVLASIHPEITRQARSALDELEKVSDLGRKLFENAGPT